MRLRENYGVVANEVVRNADLSIGARLVYTLLATRASDEGFCWPSVRTLMSETGASRASVNRWLRELVAANVLRRIDRMGLDGRQTSSMSALIEREPRGVTSETGEGVTGETQNKTTKNKTPSPRVSVRGGRK